MVNNLHSLCYLTHFWQSCRDKFMSCIIKQLQLHLQTTTICWCLCFKKLKSNNLYERSLWGLKWDGVKECVNPPLWVTWHSFSPIKLPQKCGICIVLAAYQFNPQFHGTEAGLTRIAWRFCGQGVTVYPLSLWLESGRGNLGGQLHL